MTKRCGIPFGLLGVALILTVFLAGTMHSQVFGSSLLLTAPLTLPSGVSVESRTASSIVSSPPLTATTPVTSTSLFDGQSAYRFALDQCALGPRPTGSAAGQATGDYIIQQLKASGWDVSEQQFSHLGLGGRNIIGVKGSGPVVLLGAHYDTRPVADRDPSDTKQLVPGGNDGASGVAVLLELARTLDTSKLNRQVSLAFFDAEDRGGLDGWPFSVGSEYMAAHLTIRPDYMILVDMVGDRDQNIYWETNSNPALMQDLWSIASALGYSAQFIPENRWGLTDDHIPFVNRGIPSVDIIDFDYPYWHTALDTCDKISSESLERVGRVLQVWLSQQKGM
jgi:glutaminyl-peptide cyclotransferase